MDELERSILAGIGAAAAGTMAVGARAAALGHEATIERTGRRFRIGCTCGWKTQANWTRKHSFQAITQHVTDVVGGRVAPHDPAAGTVGSRQVS